jgi:hypothetical protein
MPRAQEYEDNAARQAAYRDRKKLEEPADVPPDPSPPESEQEIRDRYGYAPSETRTQAERAATAVRMIASQPEGQLEAAQAIWERHAPVPAA